MIKTIGFGGGCHWCTEAIFESLLGVESVAQGWIASDAENTSFSEAVIVTFDEDKIPFETLIAVHLHTHSSTAEHTMRDKYSSAVYTFSDDDIPVATAAIENLQNDFEQAIITKVLRFREFKNNRDESLHYYFSDPQRPFCQTYITPKLKILLQRFATITSKNKLKHLE